MQRVEVGQVDITHVHGGLRVERILGARRAWHAADRERERHDRPQRAGHEVG
jgi:hypothetical protein